MNDVLTELALDGARSVRRAVSDPGRPGLAGAVGSVVRESLLMLDFVSGCRDDLDGRLRTGAVPAVQLRAACEASLLTLDTLLEAAPDLRRAAERHCRPDDRTAIAAGIDRLERESAALRRPFADWLAAVNRPPPPVDEERLRRGAAEAAAGETVRYDSADDLVRDLAGG